MKGFFSFVRKETLHILRDRRTMLIVLLMPVVQLLLFGFAISVEVNNIDFAVVASHPTEAVRRQVERIAANPYFTFGGYIRQDEADEVLRTGEVGAVVVFADDYDRRTAGSGEPDGAAIQLIFDASNPNDASSGAGYLRSVLLAEGTGGAPTPELHLLYNPQMKSSYNFVPGLMGLIFMLICAMMTSVSIVREKETGTMEVLLVSPVRPLRIVVAKMIPYFLLSCVNLATILLLARFVLGVPMSGQRRGTGGAVAALSRPGARAGALHLDDGRQPGDGDAHFGHVADLAAHHALGDGLPDREHARRFAGNLLYRSRPLVYRGRAQIDGRGVALRCRAERVRRPGRHDRCADRRGARKVQR